MFKEILFVVQDLAWREYIDIKQEEPKNWASGDSTYLWLNRAKVTPALVWFKSAGVQHWSYPLFQSKTFLWSASSKVAPRSSSINPDGLPVDIVIDAIRLKFVKRGDC